MCVFCNKQKIHNNFMSIFFLYSVLLLLPVVVVVYLVVTGVAVYVMRFFLNQ